MAGETWTEIVPLSSSRLSLVMEFVSGCKDFFENRRSSSWLLFLVFVTAHFTDCHWMRPWGLGLLRES